jgi:4-hydroxy-2-oxoheptanedioate aldolase
MRENTTKAKLRAGGAVFGVFCKTPDPVVGEIAAMCGWDFVMCDCEHGPGSPHEFQDFARAVELAGATPQVRVADNDKATILRFMDAGAHGVHVPWVNTGADAERAVRAVKYHPRGERGLGGTRASAYGLQAPVGEYIVQANRETMIVLQAETGDAAENIDEICAVEGFDVIFIGPTDLSHSLGVAGQLGHPEVVAAMDRVAKAVLSSDKKLGIQCGSVAMTRTWLDKGATYVVTSADQFMARAMRQFLEEVTS